MPSGSQASQFNRSFSAKALCNWEVPAVERARTPGPRHPAAKGKTEFITDDKGHLLKRPQSALAKSSSFTTGYEHHRVARWPGEVRSRPAGTRTGAVGRADLPCSRASQREDARHAHAPPY